MLSGKFDFSDTLTGRSTSKIPVARFIALLSWKCHLANTAHSEGAVSSSSWTGIGCWTSRTHHGCGLQGIPSTSTQTTTTCWVQHLVASCMNLLSSKYSVNIDTKAEISTMGLSLSTRGNDLLQRFMQHMIHLW
jgi:hypothetical protein